MLDNIPRQTLEAADMAVALHEQMFSADAATPPPANDGQDAPQGDATAQSDTAPPQTDEESAEKWKARYESLQGKYNAEVPKLHSELTELKEKVFRYIGDTAERQTQPPSQPEPQMPSPVIEALVERYGEEYVTTHREFFKTVLDEVLKDTLAPLEKKVSSVEDLQHDINLKEFKENLTKAVKGDWETLWNGGSPDFDRFALEVEPMTGMTYAEILDGHNSKWNWQGMARIFNAFYESHQKPQTTEAPKPQPNPAQQALVAPPRQTTHTPPPTNDKKVWTPAMIDEFKRNDRMGQYDAETSAAMWNDLLAALGENRIQTL